MVTVGARDLRSMLPSILRDRNHIYRVMVHNRPAVTILPDSQYLFLMEIVQEVQNMGLLPDVIDRLERNSKKSNPWFWSPEWQKGHQAAEADISAGRVKEYASMDDLIKALE